MKRLYRVALLTVIVLLVSSAAFANSVPVKPLGAWGMDNLGAMTPQSVFANNTINQFNIYNLTNTGGTIVYNPTTQTLTLTSTITAIYSGSQVFTGNFGTITFTTGALQSGNVFTFATFAGGTVTITTNGTDGLPNGVFLSGATGTVGWHEIGNTGNYWFSSNTAIGGVHQISTFAGGNQFNVSQGATVIPEPSTLALLGTGALAMIGKLRKKIA